MIDNACFVACLYTLGLMIKKTEKISDKYIPIILGLVSIIICIIYKWDNGIVDGIVNGIVHAGTAVFGNQIYKQLEKDE